MTETNFIYILKNNILNLLRIIVHSIRYTAESIRDSFRMWKHYGRYSRGNIEKESTYKLPEYLKSAEKSIEHFKTIDNNLFSNASNITIISNTLPRFTEGSDGFRLFNIIKILMQNDFNIHFLYYGKRWNDFKLKRAFIGKINFKYIPLDHKDWDTISNNITPHFVWITNLWSIRYFQFINKFLTKNYSKNVHPKIIVDTMDFHYKELYRKYNKTGNENDLKLAKDYLNNEQLLYRAADCVVVVSDEEKIDIQAYIEGIKRFEIIPNIHDIPTSIRPYAERRNICFVGSFETSHNADAVRYFIKEIFPLIKKHHQLIEFHVIGYGSENFKNEFESSNVKVIGSLKRLNQALSYYRLFVCPMTYGAGVKGKIGSAIEAGIPVVTTSIGAEGLPLKDGKECFIADSPIDFADKCNQCLNDEDLWHHLSIQSRKAMTENFSPYIVSKQLAELLK